MKHLIPLLENILSEAPSKATEQAHQLGLRYGGRGRWYDSSGQHVANSIKNGADTVLVKIDKTQGQAQPTDQNSEESPSMQTSPKAEPEEDSYTGGEEAPPEDAEIPAMSTALERMLAAAGGDAMKVRKSLVKKMRGPDGKIVPNEKYQGLLGQLDNHEAEQSKSAQDAVAKVAQRNQDALAAKKAKWNSLYPSPQI